jgi:hypothetical protein
VAHSQAMSCVPIILLQVYKYMHVDCVWIVCAVLCVHDVWCAWSVCDTCSVCVCVCVCVESVSGHRV